MCLILFAWMPSEDNRLTVAANRDEFYHRPSRPAHFWGPDRQLLAGKDLQQHGTWLGITRSGRFAAVTNFRRPDKTPYPLSRGSLTANFLNGDETPEQYLKNIQQVDEQYAGFNLLIGDQQTLFYYSNRSDMAPQPLKPGFYGLSNHLLNTPWPKVKTGLSHFKQILSKDEFESFPAKEQALLKVLQSESPAEDEQLPETGVGAVIEKMLSPRFIKSPSYGTRASTVLSIARDGEINFLEQNYERGGQLSETIRHHINSV